MQNAASQYFRRTVRTPERRQLIRRDLKCSIGDGAAFSVMVGSGETYLPAFALALGLSQVFAGLVATVPLLIGALLQLASPQLIKLAGTHRRWVIFCSVIQALAFLPLVRAALTGQASWVLVFAMASLYWGAGLATGPAWNTWMARAVPHRIRNRFFTVRTRVTHAAVLLGLVGGGALLQYKSGREAVLSGFVILFAGAFLFRMLSAGLLYGQREPGGAPIVEQRITPRVLFKIRRGPEGKLLIYMLCVQVATHIAAPYFTPFMLTQLDLSYGTYVSLLASSFIAKLAFLPLLGRLARRWGARALLWMGGVGIVPMAGFWILSDSVPYLMVVQMIGGVAWAAYELATILLLFETIRDEDRTGILTTFNLVNALAIAGGSLIGALLLRWIGVENSAYLWLFLISTVARLLAVPLLRSVADMPRVRIPSWIGLRTLAVRPMAGSIERPLPPSLIRKRRRKR
jgi:MFS family permease